MRPSPIAVLALLAALILPAPSAAQESDWRVHVTPRIGYLTPVGELVDASSRVDGSTIRSLRVEIEGTMTAGLSFGIGNEALGLGLRGTVDRTMGATTSVLAGSSNWTGIYLSRASQHDLSTAVTEAGLELLLPTRLEIAGVSPYVSAGVGLRHYDFEEPPEEREEWEAWVPFPGGGTVVDVLVGGGIDFRLLGRDLDLAVYDAISKYRGEEAHHVRVSLGVPLGLSF